MKKPLEQLVEISRFYGSDKEFVLGGGGNTSYKNEKKIWVKASGVPLATINKNGFTVLSREKLNVISKKKYSDDPTERENQVKKDLYESKVDPEDPLRPSVETSLHNLIRYAYVVHLHPTLVNGLMCARNSAMMTRRLFGDKILYIPYTDPGYTLYKKIEAGLIQYRSKNDSDPRMIFLENHGVFVSADNLKQIRTLYNNIIKTISAQIKEKPVTRPLPDHPEIKNFLPALRMLLSGDHVKILKYRYNSFIQKFSQSKATFSKASLPFSPDIIVYCKSQYLYLENAANAEELIRSAKKAIPAFREKYGYDPKIILVKDIGLIASEDNANSAETALDVYEDLLKISSLTENFGGPRFMTPEQIAFIDNWEVEHYRRKVAKGTIKAGRVENKIAIVTGGAQGFGAGIAQDLFCEGANVIIADMNKKKGEALVQQLNKSDKQNRCFFKYTDVSESESVKSMVYEAVRQFGGLDLLISNAGIIYAGSLDEMQTDIFDRMTRINYTGYFLCAKYSSEIFRIQNAYKSNYFTDIIQINSKSGLKGSKKNFTYAGAKFGGIGLTQSFALEMVEYCTKVNAICPGNFFEGPLWSDPEHGLFRQYLETGKVPGAKTIEDVKRHYEEQIPMKRGCTVTDIMKAIYYSIDQKYETGQAIPVTGGQVMIN
jgi:rhamnose utilization protein RhaD (predicted bifunctional aldolase and dehydrogenase)/NAD(P)-dependent dehydrogenase (short-subunit alcohol dehydrogenase family)